MTFTLDISEDYDTLQHISCFLIQSAFQMDWVAKSNSDISLLVNLKHKICQCLPPVLSICVWNRMYFILLFASHHPGLAWFLIKIKSVFQLYWSWYHSLLKKQIIYLPGRRRCQIISPDTLATHQHLSYHPIGFSEINLDFLCQHQVHVYFVQKNW